MHEFGLCKDIVSAVERRADGRRVTAVRVRVGVAHRVSEHALAQAFTEVAEGTVADGAAIEVVSEPMRATCHTCGASADAQDPFDPCAACGGTDLDVHGGDALLLESITVPTTEAEGRSY